MNIGSLVEQLNIVEFTWDATSFESRMDLTSFHSQPFGFVNGGAYAAFGEALAGMASNEILGTGYVAFGQSLSVHHVKAKRCEGYVLGKGILLHQGRRNHVWSISIYDEKEQLLSHMTVTNAIQEMS